MRKFLTAAITCFALIPQVIWAEPSFEFELMDGQIFQTGGPTDGPVLIANTASRCAFTRQYDDLQEVYDEYRDEGLTVLALPSNDFRQELATNEQIKEFCAINFDLDVPMGMMIKVRGDEAHPFYQWLKAEVGFEPRWNFNKVLLSADGEVLGTWRAPVSPTGSRITEAIEKALLLPR